MVGGGTNAAPGEISLAHNGVLFLDEIPEFPKRTLEALRQPLEDHTVHISRAGAKATYPANFILLATMNPCPCGYYGDPDHTCECSQQAIQNYQHKLSGPLLDRIDLFVQVSRVPRNELTRPLATSQLTLDSWRHDITLTRQVSQQRQGHPNSNLTNHEIRDRIKLTTNAQQLLDAAMDKLHLSARSYFRIIRVAATIADLTQSPQIDSPHIAEALQYRPDTTSLYSN